MKPGLPASSLDLAGELRTYILESIVDSGGKRLHTCSRTQSNQRNNQRILDQILTLFACQNGLELDRQHQKPILHLEPHEFDSLPDCSWRCSDNSKQSATFVL